MCNILITCYDYFLFIYNTYWIQSVLSTYNNEPIVV